MIGHMTVIFGCMFSGKTEELIRLIRRAQIAGRICLIFKPAIDNRYGAQKVSSHNGEALEAIAVSDAQGILGQLTPNVRVVAIDEAQFFDPEIVDVCKILLDRNLDVLVAGLALDFRGEPFGQMPNLLAMADKVVQLYAICTYRHANGQICGEPATRTQRIVGGVPADYSDPLVVIGAQETYEARCSKHHVVSGKPLPEF